MEELYLIWKLLMSIFQIGQFQIEFWTLRLATQRNIVKQGTYKSWSCKEAIGAAKNWSIGNYCQRMASNEIGYKIMSSLPCLFLMTQRSR